MPELHPQFLIERESAKKLVRLGGYEPQLESIPRRRSEINEEIENIEDARRVFDEPKIPWETVKAEMEVRG